jgi:hypothetical protein
MARSELERARRGMERDAVTDGARRGMGVRHWMGSRVEWDEVRSGEDGSSERTVQHHAMDEHGSGRNFLERDGKT